jgi:peptidylprolyl isomerase
VLLVLALAPSRGAQATAGSAIPAPADVAAPPAAAEVTASGLATVVLQPGTGDRHPQPQDRVRVHYTGWTTDGTMFDSSVARDQPAILPVDKVIDGWVEGLQLMVEGEKRRLWIPENLAYRGQEGKPAGMLVFDVELLELFAIPPVPADVAGPPADAVFGKKKLAWKVLQEGTGSVHPGPRSTVRVHYTGWTTDGAMFDSSYTRGEPDSFPLDAVIKGWTEGLQLMVEGETRRFWIPEKLAYKGNPDGPQGVLVFDIELLEIEEP